MGHNLVRLLKNLEDLDLSEANGVKISELIDTLNTSGLGFDFLISKKEERQDQYFCYKDHDGGFLKRSPVYLLRYRDKYEVFDDAADRGVKTGIRIHDNMENAIFDFLDRYLSRLGYIAPDSKINAGVEERFLKRCIKQHEIDFLTALKTLRFDELIGVGGLYNDKRYFNGITISKLIGVLKDSRLGISCLISEREDGDQLDGYGYYEDYDGFPLKRRPVYLLKKKQRDDYEVFGDSERGGKEWPKIFQNIDEATFYFLDMYLNDLGYTAPDSKIDPKTFQRTHYISFKEIQLLKAIQMPGYQYPNDIEGITIARLIAALKHSKLGLAQMISKKARYSLSPLQLIKTEKMACSDSQFGFYQDYDGDFLECRDVYLIKNHDQYEVFNANNRGEKVWCENYADLEDAVFDFIDRHLVDAPDSKILQR